MLSEHVRDGANLRLGRPDDANDAEVERALAVLVRSSERDSQHHHASFVSLAH